VLVNLLGLLVSLKESSKDSLATHPQDFDGHASVGSTLPLSWASVPSFPSCDDILTHTVSGVDHHWLADNQTILNELADVLTLKEIGALLVKLAWRDLFARYTTTLPCKEAKVRDISHGSRNYWFSNKLDMRLQTSEVAHDISVWKIVGRN